uniref:RRM domain-containing protein n=1 Tax=Poecilia formosa TaxID=48698 RepID=A0A087YRJ3_POEFO
MFLGNLEAGLTENDIRRAFERFGLITEVDIKRTVRGQNNTYGFIKFENLDMAHRAKVAMSGKVVGHSPIKIGLAEPMRVRDRTPPLPGRFRERDPYSSARAQTQSRRR